MPTTATKRPRYWAKRTLTHFLTGKTIEVQKAALEGPDPTRWMWAHPIDECKGDVCSLHKRTDHHMRSWYQLFRYDRGIMERLCPKHGCGHPDPDDYRVLNGLDSGLHGCCGCCHDGPNPINP